MLVSEEQYLQNIISKYKSPSGGLILLSPIYDAWTTLYPILSNWASGYLNEITVSGSHAKGTAIRGNTDLDIFVSLASHITVPLQNIYNNLFTFLSSCNLIPVRRNVSIRVFCKGFLVDITPGVKRAGNNNYHTLFRRKTGTWMQTNISSHISIIKDSGRINEIIATKIWRDLHNIDFPSSYLEFTVLNALYGKPYENTPRNFITVLEYMAENLQTARVVDPANLNNIISEDLTQKEKNLIAKLAKESSCKQYWRDILW